MSSAGHDIHEQDIGAYLLGALSEGEAERFERHLGECPICADEVERLRPAVEALPRSVFPIQAPASLKQAIMAEVASESGTDAQRSTTRRRLPRLSLPSVSLAPRLAGGLAAAALLAGATGFGLGQLGDEAASARTVQAKVDRSNLAGASASLVVPGGRGDGHAVMRVHGMPKLDREQVYEVWIQRGDEVIAHSLFRVGSDGDGVAAVRDGLDGADAVMITREPAEGSPAPTEAPVITASL